MQIETVKIVSNKSPENPDGYIVINKDDMKDGDKLYKKKQDNTAMTDKTKSE